MSASGPPVFVVNQHQRRESDRKAQLNNIAAAKIVADVLRTALGPRAMLKMLLDTHGGIVITNDGNAILREIDVNHPAAKSMIEISRAQDEEVGDGTTSVIIIAGEMLFQAEPFLQRNIHPTIIINGYVRAMNDALAAVRELAWQVDYKDKATMREIIGSCLGTKFTTRWAAKMCDLALDSVLTVATDEDGRKEVDIKRYVRVEKIPGGEFEESAVLRGVVLNKDVTHAGMRRRIENPRILLLDCPLEYKKAESKMEARITQEDHFEQLLRQEEEQVATMCMDILKFKPDLVITEKGLSDYAQHIFVKHGVTALRRAKKSDNNRIARAVGATIVNRTDEIRDSDIGTGCGLYEVRKIGDEYFSFIEQCKNPKACTVILRGASKDVLNEIERNLQDALCVARNVVFDPLLVPGGGAAEMHAAVRLTQNAKKIEGTMQYPYAAVAAALEVIPRTLAQNCGAQVVRLLTELRAKHTTPEGATWGIDGNKGVLADMRKLGVVEPFVVKAQTIKTAIETACMLLRVDDVLSGTKKAGEADSSGGGGAPEAEE